MSRYDNIHMCIHCYNTTSLQKPSVNSFLSVVKCVLTLRDPSTVTVEMATDCLAPSSVQVDIRLQSARLNMVVRIMETHYSYILGNTMDMHYVMVKLNVDGSL